MVKNSSRVTQLFYYKTEIVEIPPKFLFEPSFPIHINGTTFTTVDNVMEEMEKAERIVIERTFGLGDVLMLLPIIKELKTVLKRKGIAVATAFAPFRGEMINLLSGNLVDAVVESQDISRLSYDVGVYLDWYVEKDHATPGFTDFHRIDLYRRFFGLPQGQKPVWSDESEVGGGGYVLVHEGGNKDVKSLPRETFEYVVSQLREKHNVKTLERQERIPPAEFIERILEAECLVCMDSSPLWVAHFTRTPVVAILGPTREKERLTYHPLYPDGVRAIPLNEEINCQPCRETMGACNKKISCMKIPKEVVAEKVLKGVEEVRWKL